MPRCGMETPLGRPVKPDVYMTYAMSPPSQGTGSNGFLSACCAKIGDDRVKIGDRALDARHKAHRGKRAGIDEDHLGLAVADDIVEMIDGKSRIERQIGGADLEGGQHGDDRFEGAWDEEADDIALRDARIDQIGGKRIGHQLKLAIADRVVVEDDCRRLRSRLGVPVNDGMNRVLRVVVHGFLRAARHAPGLHRQSSAPKNRNSAIVRLLSLSPHCPAGRLKRPPGNGQLANFAAMPSSARIPWWRKMNS